MKLLFIRHGEPDYEHDTVTEHGRLEAEILAERIAPMDITEYYVSPLGRAKATAAPTLKRAGRTAVEYDWLQEFEPRIHRPDCPELLRVPWDWLPQDWLQDERFLTRDHWWENDVYTAVNMKEKYDRVIEAFDVFLAEHGYERSGLYYRAVRPNSDTLAFFCHFAVTCVFLSHLMNVSPVALWHGLVMAPTSVTTVNTEERRPGVAYFRTASIGDVSHLWAKGVEPSFAARFCEVYGNGDRTD